MPLPGKIYLGDSVYVEYDGFHFVLTTENSTEPSNRIMLEPQAVDAFNQYCGRFTEAIRHAI